MSEGIFETWIFKPQANSLMPKHANLYYRACSHVLGEIGNLMKVYQPQGTETGLLIELLILINIISHNVPSSS